MKRWEVTITRSLEYNEDDHGDFIQSAEDAERDAEQELSEMGCDPRRFEIVAWEIDK